MGASSPPPPPLHSHPNPPTLVNGQTPGPAIRARKGDRLRVRVHNQLADEEGLSLHFHGMWNRATPFADGTSLSQCPIAPGESFVYDFNVGEQTGTYFWHGHLDTLQQADGMYGPLVVEDPNPPFAYDEER
jgi:iron transport multicopper oxidase